MAKNKDNSAKKARAKKRQAQAKARLQANARAINKERDEKIARYREYLNAGKDESTNVSTEIACTILMSLGLALNDLGMKLHDMLSTSCDFEKRSKRGVLRDYWTGQRKNQELVKRIRKASNEYVRKATINLSRCSKHGGEDSVEDMQIQICDMQDRCDIKFKPLIANLSKKCKEQAKKQVNYNDVPIVTAISTYLCFVIVTRQVYDYFAGPEFDSALRYFKEYDYLRCNVHSAIIDEIEKSFKVYDLEGKSQIVVDYEKIANHVSVLEAQENLLNLAFSYEYADYCLEARFGTDTKLSENDGVSCLPGGAVFSVIADETGEKLKAMRMTYTLQGNKLPNGKRTIPCAYFAKEGGNTTLIFFSSIKDAATRLKVSEKTVYNCLYKKNKDGSRKKMQGGDYFMLISELKYNDLEIVRKSIV